MGILSRYDFIMKSTPNALNFGREGDSDCGVTLRAYNRIFFSDSIFSFYPYAEIYFKDSEGKISDRLFFVEGLELNAKLGSPEKTEENDVVTGGYLEHDYVWSEGQINNIIMGPIVSGDVVFVLTSKYSLKDVPRSRSFNYEGGPKKTIDQIIKTELIKDWNLSDSGKDKKLFISVTSGFPLVNQVNTTNRMFIELLSEFAYSENFVTSCFYTFVNSRGEFYFMTLDDLMNQKPVFDYEIDLNLDMSTDEKYIKEYTILNGGMPVNFQNYRKMFHNYSSAGVASTENPTRIHEATKFKISNNDKLLIRTQNIPTGENEFTSIDYFGIKEETNSDEFYKGYKNSKYKNTNICYRMQIVVQFNPNIVSGKTITIKIKKGTKNNEIAQEYAGKWLICKSMHLFDKDGEPYSSLTISKPKIAIDGEHPFKGDFA